MLKRAGEATNCHPTRMHASPHPQDPSIAPELPKLMAQEEAGFGAEVVVPTDALVALVCLLCSGSVDERLDLAFWALDR